MFKKIEEGFKIYKETLKQFWKYCLNTTAGEENHSLSDTELIAFNGDLAALRGMAEALGIPEEGRVNLMMVSLLEAKFNRDIKLNPHKKVFKTWKENFIWDTEINLSIEEKGKLLGLLYKNGAAIFSSGCVTQTYTVAEQTIFDQIPIYV